MGKSFPVTNDNYGLTHDCGKVDLASLYNYFDANLDYSRMDNYLGQSSEDFIPSSTFRWQGWITKKSTKVW